MERDLARMAETDYDLLIVGGGITGASIAWDASLRGLKTALVEKEDFGHATTAASSKLIHGGLRYLVNGEVSLVRESLRERRLWEKNAPHMVFPLPFLVPTYGWGKNGKAVLSLGLTAYDLLAYDRNRLDDPDKHLPSHRSLSRKEVLDLAPQLKREALSGGMLYYDCQMPNPERLCLELVRGAAAKGADVANYAQVTRFHSGGEAESGARIAGAYVSDGESGDEHLIEARLTINASGPWADKLLGLIQGDEVSKPLIRSKGIHIVTKNLTGDTALAVRSHLGGHFFVLPWRGKTLIGTTDTLFEEDPDDVGVSEGDLAAFLAVINEGLPGANLQRGDIEHFYAGLRPLVDQTPEDDSDNDDTYGASRGSEVYDHEPEDGLKDFLSAIGGKWTTSRHLAEQTVDLALRKLGERGRPCVTEETPTIGGNIARFSAFREGLAATHPSVDGRTADHLAETYGTMAPDLLALAGTGANRQLGERLTEDRETIGAEIIYAVRHEMARTLEDVVMRRTGLGTLGHPGEDALGKAADLMAEELGWEDGRKMDEIAKLAWTFKTTDAL